MPGGGGSIYIHTLLTLTKNSLARVGFELVPSCFQSPALLIEVLSQLGLVAGLEQFKCPKYYRNDLTLVLEGTQCFIFFIV